MSFHYNPPVSHYVYILEMLTGQLYVGVTRNLEKRMKYHSRGFGQRTTRLGGYKRLLYSETYPDYRTARERERQIKGWTRAKKLALASGNLSKLRKLSKRRRQFDTETRQ